MILSPGGSAPVHAVIPPGTKGRHTLGTKGRHPPDQKQTPNNPSPAPKADPPGTKSRHPGTKSRHPRTKSRHPPDQRQTATTADGTHPTGMHSCYRYYICMVALHLFVYVCMFFFPVSAKEIQSFSSAIKRAYHGRQGDLVGVHVRTYVQT